jgi:dTDP-4-dehydrorhamnose reductase
MGQVLLTGASGTLGRHILATKRIADVLAPSHDELDVRDADAIKDYIEKHDVDAVVHCAALARVSACEERPDVAISVNVVGTSNLVMAILGKERATSKQIRFVYVSSDGVYPSTDGNYAETDAAIPYNTYGWTKLGGEAAVNVLPNACIIRTRFYDPTAIKYDKYATDAYSSQLPVTEIASAVLDLLESSFTGTINVGGQRRSDFDVCREHKPTITGCSIQDILGTITYKIATDASLDTSRWKAFLRGKK